MIKVATAECFTHGHIAREIHAISQGYEGKFGPNYPLLKNITQDLTVVCGIFAPTLSALQKVLEVDPPEPLKLIRGIKVYNEENDKKVAVIMAESVKNLSGADIGIGTTAGIGRGGVAISTGEYTVVASSGFYADLTTPDSLQLFKRQECGIKKALSIFVDVLDGDVDRIERYGDIEIINNEK
ncbi:MULTISPECIES: UPF0254 family protein [Methanobacterium]|jgi:uncharacterized protein (UPF0254 family)|uniref:UPF0254 protein O3H35_13735 n=1 Tax=Methanobacterium veterum TaxID=408577 RepID=A0A9E5A2X7_9EURY|nr:MULTISPECIES: UPF0254 family protein [Methanobacterium]MCZ3367147.1 UPF0254 family protein [Methanobacterium veterum]MCZ3373705.1 UPF0254 family protein [Methanobacterium veterum]